MEQRDTPALEAGVTRGDHVTWNRPRTRSDTNAHLSHLLILTHFELRRLVVGVRVLLHQHHVQDAERVLNAEDGPIAPSGRENHQPAEASLGGNERASSSSAVLLHLDRRLGVGHRGRGRFGAGLEQLRGAVLRRGVALSARRLVARPVVVGGRRSSDAPLRRRVSSCLLRPGRLRLDPHAVWSGKRGYCGLSAAHVRGK